MPIPHPLRARTVSPERARAAAKKLAARTQQVYAVFAIMGGYETRPKTMGPPSGSHTFLEDVVPLKARPPRKPVPGAGGSHGAA